MTGLRTVLTGRHLMIDMETLGTGHSPVVLQVAAVEFWPAEPGREGDFVNLYPAVSDSLARGRQIDADTLHWWVRQPDEARLGLFNRSLAHQESFGECLRGLADFCEHKTGRGLGGRTEPLAGVWSHGAAFDVARLETAYKDAGMRCPWPYTAQRCTRTLFALTGKRMDELAGHAEGEVAHDALSDCRRQVRAVRAAIDILEKGSKT